MTSKCASRYFKKQTFELSVTTSCDALSLLELGNDCPTAYKKIRYFKGQASKINALRELCR